MPDLPVDALALVSHELRTPLNVVLGWARFLRDADDPARRARAVEAIEQHARTLSRLVDDLLDFCRISTGNIPVQQCPTDMAPLVASIVEAMSVIDAAPALRADLPPEPVIVAGDAARLQQVVWNLIANAFKFTPADGQVTVTLRRCGGCAHLSVVDTGSGIEASKLNAVFEPFWQGDGASDDGRPRRGLGLGLAIVRAVVEAHGGTVTAASDGPGTGATFTVRLPLAARAE